MYPRIRALREDNDLSQTMVAKMLDMSQTGYSKYETGENDISPALLTKLAYFYDTSVDYLLGITDSKDPGQRAASQLELYRKYRKIFSEMTAEKDRRSRQ